MRPLAVLLFGTFDHFHPGHEFVIREALKRGQVTVIIARDRNVERIKGFTASQPEEERAQTVRDAFPNVTVLLGDAQDFLKPVREIKPDLILLGYDQQLPPGVSEKDFLCPMERLPAHEPHQYKSSLRRKGTNAAEATEAAEESC